MVYLINLFIMSMLRSNPDATIGNTEVVETRPIDALNIIECEDGSIRIVSDVTLLFNMERLQETLGEDNIRSLIRAMQTNPKSPYADGTFTDDQLLQYIKSRYIQHPSEIRAWMETLVDEADLVKSDYENLASEVQAAQSAQATESETKSE
jgi:hypothetical protein